MPKQTAVILAGAVAKGAFASSLPLTVASTSTDIAFTVAPASGAPAWLVQPSPSAGSTVGQNTVTVIVNPTSLDAGTYTSSIVLTATTAGVQNSPVTVPVTTCHESDAALCAAAPVE